MEGYGLYTIGISCDPFYCTDLRMGLQLWVMEVYGLGAPRDSFVVLNLVSFVAIG